MGYIYEKHDIGILKQDASTKVGIMLALDSKGIPIYEVLDDEFLAEQRTEVAGYGGLPFEKEMRLSQDDWRSGFGLEVYDRNDPKRYHSSIGMDLRFRGMAIAGPISTAATLPTLCATTVTDGGLENWTGDDADSWTEVESSPDGGDTATVTKEVGTVKVGSAAADLYVLDAGGGGNIASAQIYQEFSWDAAYQGQTVYIGYWVNLDTTPTGWTQRCTIEDGTNTTFDVVSGLSTGAWHWRSVTHVIAGDASHLRVTFVNASDDVGNENAHMYIDGVQVAVLGVISDFTEFNDDLYFKAGQVALKMANGTGTISYVNLLPATITDIEAFTDDNLYWCLGATYDYFYMSTSDVFTMTDSKAYYMKINQESAGDTMWKVLLPKSVYSATAPTTDAGWSGATTIGTSDKNITELDSFDNTIYVMKENIPYYLNSSGVVYVLTNITRPIGSSTSGQNSIDWKAHLFMPWGEQGLLDYDLVEGDFSWKSPAEYVSNEGNFTGRVQALAADEMWLFAILDNSTEVEVLAGRWETINGTTSWVWHPIHELTLTGCQTAFVSSVYKKRLWIASTDSTESLFYIDLPTGYGDIVNDANFTALTGTYFETPWLHGEFKGDKKAFYKLTLKLGHVHDANIYFKAYYKLWGDSSWSSAITGNFVGTSTVRIASQFIDVSNKPSSEFIKFKIEAITDDSGKTPILLDYLCQAGLFATRRKVIQCVARCADDILNKQGQKDENKAKDVRDALEEASADATWPVTFYDIWGATKTVTFLPTKPFSKVVKREKISDKINTEHYYFLRLQEVSLS